MKKNNPLFFIVIGVIVVLAIVLLVMMYFEMNSNVINYNDVSEDGTFSTSFIRESHKMSDHKNYMISPYSVEIALSMLREGAGGSTLEEFNVVVPERSIKTMNVTGKVNVANALFVKEKFKNDVLPTYYDKLKNDYNSEVLYDKYETPDKINNWVNKETNGMIKKVVDQIDPHFVLGLANAVAMEEEWAIPFECERTTGYAFTKYNNKQFDTAMMFNSYEEKVGYYSDDKADVVTIPYKTYNQKSGKEVEEGEQLDFVGILPKDLDKYIASLDLDTIKEIEEKQKIASDKLEVTVGLPRFEFDYDFKQFKDTLVDMGIKEVFEGGADLTNMLEGHDAYVNEAVHKTYVKVDEKGTKAAAVTYFGIKDNAAVIEDDKEYVSVIFDRPFIFMIKDHNSHEILFFGVVYSPEKWNGKNTCE